MFNYQSLIYKHITNNHILKCESKLQNFFLTKSTSADEYNSELYQKKNLFILKKWYLFFYTLFQLMTFFSDSDYFFEVFMFP